MSKILMRAGCSPYEELSYERLSHVMGANLGNLVYANSIYRALTVDDSAETYPTAGIDRAASVEKLIAAILEAGTTEGVDTATGATFTSTAVVEAVNKYGFWGAFTGSITRTAAGITAAVVFGLLNALIFRPHAKP